MESLEDPENVKIKSSAAHPLPNQVQDRNTYYWNYNDTILSTRPPVKLPSFLYLLQVSVWTPPVVRGKAGQLEYQILYKMLSEILFQGTVPALGLAWCFCPSCPTAYRQTALPPLLYSSQYLPQALLISCLTCRGVTLIQSLEYVQISLLCSHGIGWWSTCCSARAWKI